MARTGNACLSSIFCFLMRWTSSRINRPAGLLDCRSSMDITFTGKVNSNTCCSSDRHCSMTAAGQTTWTTQFRSMNAPHTILRHIAQVDQKYSTGAAKSCRHSHGFSLGVYMGLIGTAMWHVRRHAFDGTGSSPQTCGRINCKPQAIPKNKRK